MNLLPRVLNFSGGFLLKSISYLCEHPAELLAINFIRLEYSKLRLKEAQPILDQLSGSCALEDDKAVSNVDNTFRHNLANIDPSIAWYRPMALLGPILGMDQVLQNMQSTKILIIGPRNEQEILWYASMGFNANNIVGLDLITYSDFIVKGDMHNMPFPDNTFDVVLFSWVLGYSSDQRKAVLESIRVVKAGGLVGIGEQWDPKPRSETSADMNDKRGYKLEGTETKSVDQLLQLFSGYDYTLRLWNEPLQSQRSRIGHLTTIVQVNK